MDHKYYSIVEIVFTHAIVLSLAAWQLVSINREIARDKKTMADAEARNSEGSADL